MSNLLDSAGQEECLQNPCNAVAQILQPASKDLGGFSVRRVLPAASQAKVGPWIFFDHAGPAQFQPGHGVDVRPHPHINLATVTYLFEGQFMHRDSLGNAQIIKPGDINLMVAGSGIVHSERTPQALRADSHSLHGLQLWLALPEQDEETDPAFYHYPASDLPSLSTDNTQLRVMMGEAFGLKSPVKTFAHTLYVEAQLQQGAVVEIPAAEECAVYIAAGKIEIDDVEIDEFSMAILNPHHRSNIHALAATRLAIIGGEQLSHRHIHWNFVSSRKERIEKAREDWRAGRFDVVPGDEEEFIPLPE